MKELQAIVRVLMVETSGPAALATLVSVEGSSYRRPGARLLVYPDGTRVGSISGGCLEEDVVTRAQSVIVNGRAERVVYDTTSENDLVWGVGLGCHGVVRVLIEPITKRPEWAVRLSENFSARRPTRLAVIHQAEPAARLGTTMADSSLTANGNVYVETIRPPIALFVFGAGDDAQPLVRLAKELGWKVTVADPRSAFATHDRYPAADCLLTGPVNELPARIQVDRESVAVIMTHHYVHDRPLLQTLLPQPFAYVGLLGPRKRAEKILADLVAEGFTLTREQHRRLHAPVGLDLGADGPEQVALAIVAEIQATLSGRDGQPLRDRREPIHA